MFPFSDNWLYTYTYSLLPSSAHSYFVIKFHLTFTLQILSNSTTLKVLLLVSTTLNNEAGITEGVMCNSVIPMHLLQTHQTEVCLLAMNVKL